MKASTPCVLIASFSQGNLPVEYSPIVEIPAGFVPFGAMLSGEPCHVIGTPSVQQTLTAAFDYKRNAVIGKDIHVRCQDFHITIEVENLL